MGNPSPANLPQFRHGAAARPNSGWRKGVKRDQGSDVHSLGWGPEQNPDTRANLWRSLVTREAAAGAGERDWWMDQRFPI